MLLFALDTVFVNELAIYPDLFMEVNTDRTNPIYNIFIKFSIYKLYKRKI